MPSIRQNAYPDVLPDFRNLAVMARVLVAVNGLALAGALYATNAFAPAFDRFMYAAAFLEPLLLVELVVLFAAAASLIEEAKVAGDVTGIGLGPYNNAALLFAAWQGNEAELSSLLEPTLEDLRRRDVGFGSGEEVVEDPEHQPVLHLLPLGMKIRRVNLLVVARLLLRLERHHRGDAFPRDERRTRHLPAGRRLAPARKDEGA